MSVSIHREWVIWVDPTITHLENWFTFLICTQYSLNKETEYQTFQSTIRVKRNDVLISFLLFISCCLFLFYLGFLNVKVVVLSSSRTFNLFSFTNLLWTNYSFFKVLISLCTKTFTSSGWLMTCLFSFYTYMYLYSTLNSYRSYFS